MNDDLGTIQRILGGEVDAFCLLVERYQGPLFCMLGNLVRNVNDRDDLAQETFLAAYLHLGSYNSREGKFSTWLFRIARNKCLNRLKKQQPLTMQALPPVVDLREPRDSLIEAEFFAQLDQALDGLPFEQKIAFVLAEIQELSHEEISQIERVPLGTVKSRISRAKDKLRSLLQSAPEQC
ncbi:MAG: sigma-70 family RNA polymerase sigma factor [Thermoguttaceae bacterium]|jgi:RNA polymerase sigma-70 factor (ECF subfamily)